MQKDSIFILNIGWGGGRRGGGGGSGGGGGNIE